MTDSRFSVLPQITEPTGQGRPDRRPWRAPDPGPGPGPRTVSRSATGHRTLAAAGAARTRRPPAASRDDDGASGEHRDQRLPGVAARSTKRLLDIVLAAPLLVLTAPLLLIGMALIRLELGSPVIFRQRRTGFAMRPFTLYKLRTMGPERDPDGRRRTDGERCGPVGRLLRRYSVDELPQLVNILRGDLSLVGPRPLLPRYDPCYTPRERLRFAVRPGITGLSQIHGRNTVPWDERLALDVRYVTEYALLLDLRILVRTAVMVVLGTGVKVDPTATMLDLDAERGFGCSR